MRSPSRPAPALEELESRDCPSVVFSAFSSGIWAYDERLQRFGRTTPFQPVAMAQLQSDHQLLFASFVGFGTWRFDYTQNTWSQLTSYTAKVMSTGRGYGANGLVDALYASFDGLGTWENIGGNWVQMSPYAADKLASVYPDNVYAAFTGFGLWHWAGQFADTPPVWTQVVSVDPVAMSLANGTTLYASFAGFGTYSLDTFEPQFGWTQITPAVASSITGDFAVYNVYHFYGLSTMVASFPGFGTYYYGPDSNGDIDHQLFFLTGDVASQLAAISTDHTTHDFYGAFSSGMWRSTDSWSFLAGEAPYLIAQ
jgi:hypothetical protein